MRSEEIHPGDLIAGKYRVRAILSRNHGLLVEAFHTEFDQRVIIKILPAGWSDEKELERFRREARTLAKLESEHVARIIDVGSQDDGSFYLVRQYLEGTDLARYLRQSGPLPLADAVTLVLQTAEAVAETHGHGIIVRELQPSHLFLTQRAGGAPLVKVIDFGTAKLMRDSAAPGTGELTATAMFGLSPYSSPELVRKAKNVDVRTDVWSLGAILYELLTGRPPFSGDMAMLMLQITKEEPVPATQYRPDLPADIDAILGWALAKDVDGRFRNLHAFAHALTPFASTEGQLLIERIGQITQAAKMRKRVVASIPPPAAGGGAAGGYLPPPTPPPGKPRGEDTVTSIKGGFASTQPPPSAGSYGSQGLPGGPGSSSSGGGGPSSRPGRSAAARMAGGGAAGRAEGGAASSAASSTVQPATVRAVPASFSRRGRTIIYGVLAALTVVIPILVTIFVLRQPAGGPITADTGGPIEIPVPTTTAATATTSTVEPVVPPPPTSATAPVASTTTTASSTGPVATNTRTTTGTRTRTPPQPQPQPQPPPPPPPEPSGGGSSGTIVAVATGGNCAFSVNGSSKGTSSSIKVTVPPGTYSVSCKPSSGAAKSKSVKVESGKTAFAAFKL